MQPLLYTIIEKRRLHEMLETFYQCISLPIQVLDENGEILTNTESRTATAVFLSPTFPRTIPAKSFTPAPASLP